MPVCGIIDAKVATTTGINGFQEQFKVVFNFFERMVAVGNCTRKALQYGLTGTGTGYWDEGSPFKNNAFAVYEFASATPKFTVLIQYGDAGGAFFGGSPGNPGVLQGSASTGGVGISMAARADGTSPWAGTTNNNGTDTKGATVWTPGSSTLYVLDRSTSLLATAGTYATNKQNALRVTANDGTSRARLHCVGNANSYVILSSPTDNGGYYFSAGGVYTPRPGLVLSHTMPLVAWSYSGAAQPGLGSNFGLPAGTDTSEGGIVGRPADPVGEFLMSVAPASFHSTTYQPNMQTATPELDLVPYVFAFNHSSRYGYVGSFPTDVLAYCYNANNLQTDSAGTRAYIGTVTTAASKYAIPWDGGRAPGNNMTRDGRTL